MLSAMDVTKIMGEDRLIIASQSTMPDTNTDKSATKNKSFDINHKIPQTLRKVSAAA